MTHSTIIDYFLMAISAGARAAVAGLIVYGLTRFHEGLGLPERVGAGLIGGSALMTIPIVFDVDKDGTPFDVWASKTSPEIAAEPESMASRIGSHMESFIARLYEERTGFRLHRCGTM